MRESIGAVNVDAPDGSVGVLARAIGVLRCFTDETPSLTAAELADLTGLSNSTLHRILGQLNGFGLLAKAPGHRYTIGAHLWELGELSPLALRLREKAMPLMSRLYEATSENVQLAVLDGATPETAQALFVGRLSGSTSVPIITRMGGRHPLHATGVGKALLATRDPAWLQRFLSKPLQRETSFSITDADELRADLDRVRLRGYATTREEMTLNSVSVAAALGTIDGLPRAAIGVVVHAARADERRLAPLVLQTAKDLTRLLRRA